MSGIQPYHEILDIAMSVEELRSREEITDALDRVEYLFEVITPELQEPVEQLIDQLRRKLAELG